ncbi:outer membrane lipoprotein-sorting protein [Thioalkalivibrio denitrificans]|uniref:Outer membrane lipoprotein-sorting protein n=1 Tax=Thioalkalivibrio denitrificans TaxID=108003 RepID=A0A1V3NQ74_9GAMM|nr:outer membrane lipoprotein-sorting protein [Thioalkalivibrio denitrificans]OOG27247.1 outer membrane lipoprotein-sorting protein [Thioalkalivibrio denitrificans]
MRKAHALLSWLVAVCAVFTFVPPALAEDGAGKRLAQQVYNRPDGDDMTTRGTMVLEEQGRSPRVRQMITYRLDVGYGEVWTLIRFTSPSDIADTGLLTLDHADGSSDQWLYLPALDRSRRIPSARKGGRFVGSDIFFEDLQDRKVDMDHHRILGDEEIFGVPTRILESVPVDPGNSTYGRRVSWVHEQSLLPLRIDFYAPGRDDAPVKRMEVHRLEQVQGFWTVMDSTFTDLGSGHSTRVVVDEALYDRRLPQSLFTSQSLEDPARERVHRP